MHRRGCSFVSRRPWTFCLVIAFCSRAWAGPVTIDDFGPNDPAGAWVFSNGPEFPGARGSLDTASRGEDGPGAALSYDFSSGGAYVAMTLKLAAPIIATAIGYSTNAVALPTALRVVDASGQTLQYSTQRPLESSDPAEWYRQVVDLSVPTMHSNGANDGVVHEPVTSITLIAGGEFQKGKVGAIGFDHVVAWDKLPLVLDPSHAPVPAPAAGGDPTRRLGVNVHFLSDDRALDLIRAAGFSIVRADLGWTDVERSAGVYDFSSLDKLLDALAVRGLGLHLVLGYSNDLYPTPSKPGFAGTTVPAFAAIAGAAARHFAGKMVTYEIWNEEDTPTFWDQSPSAAQYATFCTTAARAVHQADPSALVTTGGVSGFDLAFLQQLIEAGGVSAVDAIGVHPYRHGGPETASGDLADLRALVTASSVAGTPIWDTEWGYSSAWYGSGNDAAARRTQGALASRELLTAWALGFPLAVYYDIRDDGSDPANAEQNFGLVSTDYAEKPAMLAVRTVILFASGRSFRGFLPLGYSTVHAMLFAGTHDRAVAVWNSEPGTVRQVSIPGRATATDAFGSPLALPNTGGTLLLDESKGPVFVVFPEANATQFPDAGPATPLDAGTSIPNDAGTRSPAAGADAGKTPPNGGGAPTDARVDAATPPLPGSGCGCRFEPREARPAWGPFLLCIVLAGFRRTCRRGDNGPQVRRAASAPVWK